MTLPFYWGSSNKRFLSALLTASVLPKRLFHPFPFGRHSTDKGTNRHYMVWA